jgi:hypothetical protein
VIDETHGRLVALIRTVRAAERARIVAWLRKTADMVAASGDDDGRWDGSDVFALRGAAERIAHGDA